MKKSVAAKIKWVSPEDGGKKNPFPIGVKYGPIILFEGQDMEKGSWSAEIYVIEHIGDFASKIQLSYLSPEAPFLYLKSGNKFKLYEGAKMIASGEIL